MVCEVCREVVPVLGGQLVLHGSMIHGVLQPCAGSGACVCESCG